MRFEAGKRDVVVMGSFYEPPSAKASVRLPSRELPASPTLRDYGKAATIR